MLEACLLQPCFHVAGRRACPPTSRSSSRASREPAKSATSGSSEGVMIRSETPHRARISQFEPFELILLLQLDQKFPVERFEATVSQSTVPSPPLRSTWANSARPTSRRSSCCGARASPRAWPTSPSTGTHVRVLHVISETHVSTKYKQLVTVFDTCSYLCLFEVFFVFLFLFVCIFCFFQFLCFTYNM